MFAKRIHTLGTKSYGHLVATRKLQQHVDVAVNNQFTPVQIDVPWGKVAGKLWGPQDKQPILAVHGWMDNCGSFDVLAPLLKKSSILAIDLPGHGESSWIPRGIPYSDLIAIESIKLVVESFGWNKVKFLSHSLGGILSYVYAALYPEQTEFVISIDSIGVSPYDHIRHLKTRAKNIEKLIKFEKKYSDNPPSYPEDVAIEKWIKATNFSHLDVPTTKTLMIRGAKKKEDGTFYFTRDFRLSFEGFNTCYTLEDTLKISQLITCPYLVIKASDSVFKRKEYWENYVGALQKSSKDFNFVEIEGTHHLHMMRAQNVAAAINPFLEKYDAAR